jgi:hypothetical protein
VATTAEQVRDGADGYAELLDQGSRTSARARVLNLLDELRLPRTDDLRVRRVSAGQFARDAVVRGAIVMHLDLMFRSSVSAPEVAFTAEHGVVLVAEHPDLHRFPAAVVLGAPAERLLERRDELFALPKNDFRKSDVIMPYALAASPRGLGAGRRLLTELVRQCGEAERPPRITTFSPLTGMRAHIIRCVDEPTAWARVLSNTEVDGKQLRSQLLDLLGLDRLPDSVPEPARSWLQRESMTFAASDAYQVGNFHRGMGATLAGVLEQADPADSDALWWRAWFDYGRADAKFSP